MGKLHWYKRDPDAALAGMMELTLVERGAYNSIIDLLYSRDGNVPDDDLLVARMIGCHWREWKAVKARLVARGKLRLEGGKITANRVQEALKEAADFSQEQSKRAAKRWQDHEKDNNINESEMPAGNANTTTSTTTSTNTPHSPPRGARVAKRFREDKNGHAVEGLPVDPWDKRVADYRADLDAGKERPFWQAGNWGPPPGLPHCHAPPSILERYGFQRTAA